MGQKPKTGRHATILIPPLMGLWAHMPCMCASEKKLPRLKSNTARKLIKKLKALFELYRKPYLKENYVYKVMEYKGIMLGLWIGMFIHGLY